MILQTANKSRANSSVIFPVVGTVIFDKDCQIEVSEKDGKELLSDEFSYLELTEVGSKKEKKEVVESTKEDKIEEKKDKISASDLKALSLSDLKELAKTAELPAEEWESLNKNKMIGYLVPKI